ncbi:MAG: hypothetical protein ACLGI3_07290, partial [Actinomycetes bacterium]
AAAGRAGAWPTFHAAGKCAIRPFFRMNTAELVERAAAVATAQGAPAFAPRAEAEAAALGVAP